MLVEEVRGLRERHEYLLELQRIKYINLICEENRTLLKFVDFVMVQREFCNESELSHCKTICIYWTQLKQNQCLNKFYELNDRKKATDRERDRIQKLVANLRALIVRASLEEEWSINDSDIETCDGSTGSESRTSTVSDRSVSSYTFSTEVISSDEDL